MSKPWLVSGVAALAVFTGCLGWFLSREFNSSETPLKKNPYVVFVQQSVARAGLDFSYALYGLKGDLVLLDLRTSKTITLTTGGNCERPFAGQNGKLYCSAGEEGKEAIWVFDLENRTFRKLISESYYTVNPSCSHDGRFIVFEGRPKSAREIMRADSNGDNITVLTRGASLCGSPSFSADDKKIVFDCRADGKYFGLWVMNADGKDQRPLFSETAVNFQRPSWSPNGKWVVCQSDKADKTGFEIYGIYAMELDRQGQAKRMIPVAVDGYDNRNPRWSSDGRYIIFQSKRLGNTQSGQSVYDFDLFMVKFDPDVQESPIPLTKMFLNERDPSFIKVSKDKYFWTDLLGYVSGGFNRIGLADSSGTGI